MVLRYILLSLVIALAGDKGLGSDPNGLFSDDGPYIDPNGRTSSAVCANGDYGCGIDPNG